MRLHKNFWAAWIFLCGEIPADGYQFLFLMQPQNEALFLDLNITVQAARSKTKDKVELGMLDEQDVEYIAKLFQQAPTFYVAAENQ